MSSGKIYPDFLMQSTSNTQVGFKGDAAKEYWSGTISKLCLVTCHCRVSGKFCSQCCRIFPGTHPSIFTFSVEVGFLLSCFEVKLLGTLVFVTFALLHRSGCQEEMKTKKSCGQHSFSFPSVELLEDIAFPNRQLRYSIMHTGQGSNQAARGSVIHKSSQPIKRRGQASTL